MSPAITREMSVPSRRCSWRSRSMAVEITFVPEPVITTIISTKREGENDD
jgi:hypothetical protein